jgi:diguanylate cyclase (GGDEF)-like protein/PAS domain S-box-containing protein
MSMPAALRIGPIARISLGLVALLVSLVLLADMLLGVVPVHGERQREARQRVAENLALQFTALLESGDTATLGKSIRHVLARDADITSITVRRSDGSTLLQHGQPQAAAAAARQSVSTADRLRVPILAGRQVWGEVDVQFVPTAPTQLGDWLRQPYVQLLAVLAIGGFLLCYAYLRRAMQYLNPSASVPDRVRTAFDSISEGLLVLDLKGRIVLANKAFRQLHPRAEGELTGQHIDQLDWLQTADAGTAVAHGPWRQTLASGVAVAAQALTLPRPDGAATQLLVSSAAITDNKGRTRGCLVTFDNVTAVHRANEELRSTLAQLEASRERIEEQNAELRRLASRDALTGCFNRRAFFEQAEALFSKACRQREPLCCLMIDIDHFKQFNDRHGHAVGDQVIQVVARCLAAGLRQVDVLARYGGEEFCIVLPGTAPQDALAVAERIRVDIETSASRAIRGTDVQQITASFGLVALHPDARTIEVLIDQADQALYRSKKAGRNRVTVWDKPAATAAPQPAEPAVSAD